MKTMSWGYKIMVVYALFVVGIGYLVYQSSNQKMDLVTADYYAKELKYQDQMDGINRTNNLTAEVACEVKDGVFQIRFPDNFNGKVLTGDAVLYCPMDENRDITRHFDTREQVVTIPLSAINKGQYELHLSWKADGVAYYLEKRLFL